MKKIFIIILAVVFTLFATSCNNLIRGRVEIDKLMFARVLGIDCADDGDIKIIVTTKMAPSTKQEGESVQTKSDYITGDGSTLFDAITNMGTYSDKKIFFGDTEFVIISEKAADKGLNQYIDYILRDNGLRLNARIYIVQDITAEELIKSAEGNKQFLGERIKSIEVNDTISFNSIPVNIVEAANFLASPTNSLYIPVIKQVDKEQGEEESQTEKDIKLQGFMIFQKGKPISYLNDIETKGLVWLRGHVKSDRLIIKDNEEASIAMQIVDAKRKFVPHINGEALSVDIIITVTTNIIENQGTVQKYTQDYIKALVINQNALIKEQVEALISFAQSKKADIFSLAYIFFVKSPFKFHEIEPNWQEKHFPEIATNVIVKSKIARSYLIMEPIVPEDY